jgi:hypothetical protein
MIPVGADGRVSGGLEFVNGHEGAVVVVVGAAFARLRVDGTLNTKKSVTRATATVMR